MVRTTSISEHSLLPCIFGRAGKLRFSHIPGHRYSRRIPVIGNNKMHQFTGENQHSTRFESRIGRRRHPVFFLRTTGWHPRINKTELPCQQIIFIFVAFSKTIDQTSSTSAMAVRHHEITGTIDIAPAIIDESGFGIEQFPE